MTEKDAIKLLKHINEGANMILSDKARCVRDAGIFVNYIMNEPEVKELIIKKLTEETKFNA